MNQELIRELQLDSISIFQLRLENSECYDEITTYIVEIPAKKAEYAIRQRIQGKGDTKLDEV